MDASADGRPVDTRTGQVALVTGGSSGLGEAIAQALADSGVTVNALAPGPFRTPFNEGVDDDPQVRRFLGRRRLDRPLIPAARVRTRP